MLIIKRSDSGFTIIEMLMVILLVTILAAVAIPQFLDFRVEAKDAATKSALGTVRTGIVNQKANIILRCAPTSAAVWPSASSVAQNDVILGGDCTNLQVTSADQAKLLSQPMPGNPWGPLKSNAVVACSGGGCTKSAGTDCAGAAYVAATSDGWCYNPATGDFWANSANSTGATGLEWSF